MHVGSDEKKKKIGLNRWMVGLRHYDHLIIKTTFRDQCSNPVF